MRILKNRPVSGDVYKIVSKSKSFLDRYGGDSKICVEGTAKEKFGKYFMRKKDSVIKFYRARLNEIPDRKGEVFFGTVTGTIDISCCLVHENEIGDEIRE